jgi:hypothetical protein
LSFQVKEESKKDWFDNEAASSGIPLMGFPASEALLKQMGEVVIEPGEYNDLYHHNSLEMLRSKQFGRQKTTKPDSGEDNSGCDSPKGPIPKRPPTISQGTVTTDMMVTLLLVNVADMTGVNNRLNVPRVLILAHDSSRFGQNAGQLLRLLSDTTDKRFNVHFDTSKYSHIQECKLIYQPINILQCPYPLMRLNCSPC